MKPLTDILTRCVDCHEHAIRSRPPGGGFQCDACGRQYRYGDDGVLDAFPQQRSQSQLPGFYRSPFYRKWLAVWEQMIPNWVIYEKAFYRFFSMSGHRQVARVFRNQVSPDAWMVDLGCGRGELFEFFEPGRCIGIDGNRKFLGHLKKRFPQATAIHADFTALPFGDGSLECVVSLHVLEHLYFLAESLEEIGRVVGENGAFIFSIPTEGGLAWKLGRSLVTGPHLRKKYDLDVRKVMAIEHINDAPRVLRMLRLYFDVDKLVYRPLPWIPILSVNSSITGLARWNPQRLAA